MSKSKYYQAFSLIELSIVVLIVGILLAGVTVGNSLYTRSKLATARSLTASSPVSGIKDLVMWLDATSTASFSSSEAVEDASVSRWYDTNSQSTKIGFAQTTASKKPIYEENSLSSLPSVYFDGVDDLMFSSDDGTNQRTWASSDLFYNGEVTLFIVMNLATYTSTSANQVLFYNNTIAMETNRSGLSIRLNTMGGTYSYGATNSGYFGRPIVVTGYRNSSNSVMYVNGTSYLSFSSGTYTPASAAIYIGGISGYPAKVNIGEIIMYGRALTTEEREAVETYLGQKWGVKIS